MIGIFSTLRTNNESGFTIIETMIALSIFIVVLLLVTVSISGYFTTFYRSIVVSDSQNIIQNVSNTVEQAVQYSNSLPVFTEPSGDNPGTLCVGNEEFVFNLGEEVPADTSNALYELPVAAGGVCTPNPTPLTGGNSLLGDHYRLITFSVLPIPPPVQVGSPTTAQEWTVDIKIAYTSGGGLQGDGDSLLCSTSIAGGSPGNCNPSAANLPSADYLPAANLEASIICKPTIEAQFCDTEELQSIVESRLN
jgi:type II secretory pathway pseudopilin PulG